jgi:hypothetical protein
MMVSISKFLATACADELGLVDGVVAEFRVNSVEQVMGLSFNPAMVWNSSVSRAINVVVNF